MRPAGFSGLGTGNTPQFQAFEAIPMRSILLALAIVLALPAAAEAHVLVVPDSAPQGAEMRLDIRVPNERDDATSTKLDVQLPPGFAEALVLPVAGWSAKIGHVKLDPPVQTDDGPITE